MTAPNAIATRVVEISFLVFALLFGVVFSVCSAQSRQVNQPAVKIKEYRLNAAARPLLVDASNSIRPPNPESRVPSTIAQY